MGLPTRSLPCRRKNPVLFSEKTENKFLTLHLPLR